MGFPAAAALALLLVAIAAELLLGKLIRSGAIRRPEIDLSVTIGAPQARVWAYAADIARQPEWMHEMKHVEMITPPPIGVGSRGRATVRIFGIGTTDEVVWHAVETASHKGFIAVGHTVVVLAGAPDRPSGASTDVLRVVRLQ